jgi:hypothetical protein
VFPYWIVFSFFAAGALRTSRGENIEGRQSPILATGAFLIALLVGLRFRVGADWYAYERMFASAGWLDLPDLLALGDPGYAILNWIGQMLGTDVWFVNLICAGIFSWGLFRFASQQPNSWLAFLVAIPYLVVVVAMGYTRQAVAIGVILGGLAHFERTSIWRFAIYILVAATFHKSAIIVLPFVALSETRNRLVTAVLFAIVMVVLYYLFVNAFVDILVYNYVEADYESQGATIRVAMNVLPAAVFLIYQKRFSLPPKQLSLWRNFSIAALVIVPSLFLLASTTVVDRVALYLIPLQIFVLSRLPHAFPSGGRSNSLIVGGIVAYSATIQFVWLNYAEHATDWIPYRVFPFEWLS